MIRNIINKAEQEYPHAHETGVAPVVENAVYTTGNQTIDGTKTFNNTIAGSIDGNAATVTDGVYTTGNQTIDGLKNFSSTPTVNNTPVTLLGDPIKLYAKNSEDFIVYKGQPVYVDTAQGANALLKLASNLDELASARTIGVLEEDLDQNQFGYVITNGLIDNIPGAISAVDGETIWLGPTGSLIYGIPNAPVAPQHNVNLGVVLRSANNNNKYYINVQNGVEIKEIHNVVAVNPADKDTLLYNSASGLWFSRQITTTDVSDISGYVKNIAGASGIHVLSQAEYDTLPVTDANTVYIII